MNEAKIRAALSPDGLSQRAYAGKIVQREVVMLMTEDGLPIEQEVDVVISWSSIVKMLDLIKERAGI